MVSRGYERDFAERCFKQIEGFGHYGFPESHAASFAKLVYVSAWMKWAWPDVFCAALINSQPMGFYQPAQLVRDAREHGVEVLAPDVMASDWDCTLESMTSCFAAPKIREDKIACQEPPNWKAVRLGFRQIKGLKKVDTRPGQGPRRRRPHARRVRPRRRPATRSGAAGRGRRLRLGGPDAARGAVGGQGAEGRAQGAGPGAAAGGPAAVRGQGRPAGHGRPRRWPRTTAPPACP
jgi:hypothetical protein